MPSKRLLNAANRDQRTFMRLEKIVVFDRLLARMLVIAPNRWVIKGGFALDLRLGDRARVTKDLDLARSDDEEAALDDFRAAREVDLGDYFSFVVNRQSDLDDLQDGTATRFHITATLAGRTFEDATVDVGFGSSTIQKHELIAGTNLLSFADLPPIEIPAISLEQQLAEKIHAYTRSYNARQPSSRVKDLIDFLLIATIKDFIASDIRSELLATFNTRALQEIPNGFPPPPMHWEPVFRRLAEQVGLDPDMAVGFGQAAAFLDPLLSGAVPDDSRWDPTRGRWGE